MILFFLSHIDVHSDRVPKAALQGPARLEIAVRIVAQLSHSGVSGIAT
jgi:hypothetical protein